MTVSDTLGQISAMPFLVLTGFDLHWDKSLCPTISSKIIVQSNYNVVNIVCYSNKYFFCHCAIDTVKQRS